MGRRGAMLLMVAALAGCGQRDLVGPGGARIYVDSDPRGAVIVLDGHDTGLRTPDTVRSVSGGTHTFEAYFDSAGERFTLQAKVDVRSSTGSMLLPLVARCSSTGNCVGDSATYHDVAGLHFATNPATMPFFTSGRAEGLRYPGVGGDAYASVGGVVLAGTPTGTSNAVALGLYQWNAATGNTPLWAGRPAPPDSASGGDLVLHASTWLVPPVALLDAWIPRGLQIDQRIVGGSEVEGTLVIRVVIRNISTTEAYRAIDPAIRLEGMTYNNTYVGYALDADIGADTNLDDLYTFVPSLAMAVMYDAPMREPTFAGPPALVGLRLLERPEGTTNVALSAWPAVYDWFVNDQNIGWQALTVNGQAGNPVFAGATNAPGDYRMSVTAGPLTLAPGDTTAFSVAVLVVPPAPGTYTPGTVLLPGDPNDDTRPFLAMAAPLMQRARAAEALLAR
jgi:hypothetical protein